MSREKNNHRSGGQVTASSAVSPVLGEGRDGAVGDEVAGGRDHQADPAAEGECDERGDGTRGERRRELAAEPRRHVADAARDDEHNRRERMTGAGLRRMSRSR